MTKASDYDWWKRALAGEKIGGPTLPVHDGHPQCGYYRRRMGKDNPLLPVAIWREEEGGEIICTVGATLANANEQWLWCCKHPVSEKDYWEARKHGRWDDDFAGANTGPTVPAEQPGGEFEDGSPPRLTNEPEDDRAALEDQIESALSLGKFEKIKSDQEAAKAQSLRSRLLELSRTADKRRTSLKEPYLEASKKIDAEWMPLVKAAKGGADEIAVALGRYADAKAKAAREAAAKAEAEDKPVEVQQAPAQIKGAYGRAATVTVENVVEAVNDWPALLTFLHSYFNAEIEDIATKLANRALKAGAKVPGVTVAERRKVA